jgi:hypothetical protein
MLCDGDWKLSIWDVPSVGTTRTAYSGVFDGAAAAALVDVGAGAVVGLAPAVDGTARGSELPLQAAARTSTSSPAGRRMAGT